MTSLHYITFNQNGGAETYCVNSNSEPAIIVDSNKKKYRVAIGNDTEFIRIGKLNEEKWSFFKKQLEEIEKKLHKVSFEGKRLIVLKKKVNDDFIPLNEVEVEKLNNIIKQFHTESSSRGSVTQYGNYRFTSTGTPLQGGAFYYNVTYMNSNLYNVDKTIFQYYHY